MGSSSQTQQQSSTTQPWSAAQPALSGILSKLGGLVNNSGLSQTSQNAIGQLESNAQQGNPYTSQINSTVSNLLNGGGANNQAGAVQTGFNNYSAQTNPLASNTDYNPMNTPGFADALKTMNQDITSQVNGQFAAAGRDGSGMNQQTLARGIAQGDSQAIANQYQANVQNQQNAAQNLYSAGNTTNSQLTNMNQLGLGNQIQGVSSSADALAAQNYSPTQLLQLEQLKQSLPADALNALTQMGVSIGSLGSSSSGTSTTTSNPSLLSQLGQASNILGKAGSATSGATGAMALLSLLSDRDSKEDITKIGELFDGTPVYRFRYIGAPTVHVGLMAQDIEQYEPTAVHKIGRFKYVNYDLATKRAAEMA